MADNHFDAKEKEAEFLEALNSLKEYATVNGSIIKPEDIENYFKEFELTAMQRQIIDGYLMANEIKIEGVDSSENAYEDFVRDSERAALEAEAKENGEEEELWADEQKIIDLFLEDLSRVERMDEQSASYQLMSIEENGDEEATANLIQYFLYDVVEWIEPFRNAGLSAGDLIQEASLCLVNYLNERLFLKNREWIKKIESGNNTDLRNTLGEIKEDIKQETIAALRAAMDEQTDNTDVARKIANKVNLVNDCVQKLFKEYSKKPTPEEVAEELKVDTAIVLQAVVLSGEQIENLDMSTSADSLASKQSPKLRGMLGNMRRIKG